MKRNSRRGKGIQNTTLTGKIGIHGKMLIQLSVLVGFIITLIWICQFVLLMGFFQNYRSSQVRNAAKIILANLDHKDLDELADRISAETEVCVLIADENGNEKLSTDHVRFCVLHHLSQAELTQLIARVPDDGSELIENTRVVPFRNENYHAESFRGDVPVDGARIGQSMLYAQRVTYQDGSTGILMLNAQLTPTSTMLYMLQQQYFYIVSLIILVTVIMGYLMAAGISRPMIETNYAAHALSRGEYRRPPHSSAYREISELNDTLAWTASELQKVDKMQQELIANISHDLRTPLTMIQGYAETMRDIPVEMNQENMQVIIDETHRLSSLVNEVLEFSRLRAGNYQLEMEEFNLTDTVRRICDRVRIMTEKDGYQVICSAEQPFFVCGDITRIEQVIYNFLGNALTWTGEEKRVVLKEDDLGDRVRVSIQDTGKGIPREELPYIWDRYYRSNESHRRSVIGSGLGLNICRGILEIHKAPFGVDSQPGRGTTFWFELEKGKQNVDKK